MIFQFHHCPSTCLSFISPIWKIGWDIKWVQPVSLYLVSSTKLQQVIFTNVGARWLCPITSALWMLAKFIWILKNYLQLVFSWEGGQPERILKGLCWLFSICPSGSSLHPPFLWPLLQKADLHGLYPSGSLAVWLLLDLANEDTSRRGESWRRKEKVGVLVLCYFFVRTITDSPLSPII